MCSLSSISSRDVVPRISRSAMIRPRSLLSSSRTDWISAGRTFYSSAISIWSQAKMSATFHHLGGDDVMDFLSSWDLQARFSHILEAGRANLLDGFAISTHIQYRVHSRESSRFSDALEYGHWSRAVSRDRLGPSAVRCFVQN